MGLTPNPLHQEASLQPITISTRLRSHSDRRRSNSKNACVRLKKRRKDLRFLKRKRRLRFKRNVGHSENRRCEGAGRRDSSSSQNAGFLGMTSVLGCNGGTPKSCAGQRPRESIGGFS